MPIVLASSGNEIASRGYGAYLLTSLLVLAAVCVLAWVVVRFGLRRFSLAGRAGRGGAIKVLACLPLEPRLSLYLVEAGGKTLLLGAGERGVDMLGELDRDAVAADLEGAARGRSGGGFAELVEAFRRARGGPRRPSGSDVAPRDGSSDSSVEGHPHDDADASSGPRRG